MSDTDIKGLPPQDVFVKDEFGICAWHPQFDYLCIRLGGFRQVVVEAAQKGAEIKMHLSAAEARHIGELLIDHADKLGAAE